MAAYKKWATLEITTEEIGRDWRRRDIKVCKDSELWEYYCAYGGKSCPSKIRKKVLSNGVSVVIANEVEQANHRDFSFGLTEQQKQLILDCWKSGVTFPNNLLLSFRHKEVPEPEKKKLKNFLNRHVKKAYHSTIKNDIGDVVAWAKENSAIPSDVDKPFVVKFDVDPGPGRPKKVTSALYQ